MNACKLICTITVDVTDVLILVCRGRSYRSLPQKNVHIHTKVFAAGSQQTP